MAEAMSCHPKSSAGYGVLLTTLSQNKQAAVAKGRLEHVGTIGMTDPPTD